MFENTKRATKTNIALEYIRPQKDNFGGVLALLYQDVIQYVRDHPTATNKEIVKDCSAFKSLEEAIFKRLGIKVKYTPDNYVFMAVLPMISNKYHVLLNEYLHGFGGIKEQETILKTWDQQTGTVDLEKGKVSGIFSSYTHYMFINPKVMITELEMDPEEIAAITLHELGHLFNMFEFSAHVESTNMIMAELVRGIHNNEDQSKINIIYQRYQTATNSKKDADLLTSGKSRVIIATTLFQKHFQYMESQLPVRKYDQTSSEASADLFVARFNYGRQLITALHRITDKFGVESIDSQYRGTFMTAYYGLMIVQAMLVMSLFVAAPILGVFALAWLGLVCNYSGDAYKDMTYDGIKVRYLRVREQYVNLLKDSSIPKADAMLVLEDIYAFDEIIKKLKPFTSIFARIGNLLFTANRTVKNDMEIQRILEELANNDLYLKSVELKTNI